MADWISPDRFGQACTTSEIPAAGATGFGLQALREASWAVAVEVVAAELAATAGIATGAGATSAFGSSLGRMLRMGRSAERHAARSLSVPTLIGPASAGLAGGMATLARSASRFPELPVSKPLARRFSRKVLRGWTSSSGWATSTMGRGRQRPGSFPGLDRNDGEDGRNGMIEDCLDWRVGERFDGES